MTSTLGDILNFCPSCFATNEDGSWAHTCDEYYCYNCGNCSTIKIPRWAVESIRAQASWVGKRYYPNEEDRENYQELENLRKLVPINRSDEVTPDTVPSVFIVRRYVDDTKRQYTSVTVSAKNKTEARKIANKLLPYRGPYVASK